MRSTNFLQPARASLVQDRVEYIRQEFPEKTKDMDIAIFAEGQLQGYSVAAEIFVLGEQPVELMKDNSRQVKEGQKASQ